MPVLKTQKIGIIACSGEEMPEGLVSRQVALKILNELRPHKTITLCLPLFLAGGESDRSFAKLYPTVAIDGCDLKCAYRATQKYSSRPTAGYVVTDFTDCGINNLRKLDRKGLEVVDQMAAVIVNNIDALLNNEVESDVKAEIGSVKPETATCSCGSGIVVSKLIINGKMREIIALPLLFENFSKDHKPANPKIVFEMMETIKIYNPISEEERKEYQEAILNAYQDYLSERNSKEKL